MAEVVEPEVISEIELFEQLEGLDDHVECSYTDCTDSAINLLVCGEKDCDAAETICAAHTAQVLFVQFMKIPERIMFDNTCGHNPLFSDCTIRPMD